MLVPLHLATSFSVTVRAVVVAPFRRPSNRGSWIALISLAISVAVACTTAAGSNAAPMPQETAASTAVYESDLEAAPPIGGSPSSHWCSQPAIFTGDSSLEFSDGTVNYSLMGAESFSWALNTDGRAQTIWMFIGLRTARATPAESNPWYDFSLLEGSAGSEFKDPLQPARIDVMEIIGPIPLLAGETLLLEPGMSCSLIVTFQLNPKAERAILKIGSLEAFKINLRPGVR